MLASGGWARRGRRGPSEMANLVVVGMQSGGEDSGAMGIGGKQTDDSASNAGAAYVFVRSTADR